jgi:hypothetical protein
MDLLYINDSPVDLYPNTIIATTIQRVNIGDLKVRNFSYTNQIKLPKTESNNALFGLSNLINSRSTKPYMFLGCTYLSDGIEVFANWSALLVSVDDNYNLQIFSTEIQVFDILNNKTLYDIDPIASSSWLAPNIDTRRTATSDIISAVVYWGQPGSIYDDDFFLPSFFYHSIISKIFEYTGVTVSGSILTDTRFTDLIMPYFGKTFSYDEVLVAQVNSEASGASYTVTPAPTTHKLQWDSNISGVPWDLPNDEFDMPDLGTDANISFTITLTFNVNNIVWLAGTVQAFIVKDGESIEDVGSSAVITFPATSGDLSITTTTSGNYNDITPDKFYVEVRMDASVVSIDMQAHSIEIVGIQDVDRFKVGWRLLWPDTKVTDIVKDFFIRYAIIPSVKNNVLELKTFDEIISDKANALDWTNKRNYTKDDRILFTLASYGQNNYFYYDNVSNDADLGSGFFTVENTGVEESKSIYSSIFGNTITFFPENLTASYWYTGFMEVYDDDSTGIEDFANEPELRLLTLKARTTEPAIPFNAINRTDYKIGYFVDEAKTKDTGFQYFIDQFYTSFSESLQRNKIITREYYLTPIDIANNDTYQLVYDDGSYFLINKIVNFIPGKLTKVELFKVL